MNKLKQSYIATQSADKVEPGFLRQRVDAYYRDRVQMTWQGGHIMKGLAVPTENSLVLTSNDYLSISNHPAIGQAKVDSILKDGNGLMMSSVFARGDTTERQFERAIAELMQAEDAVLSQSGWCANVGLIQAIANESTPVYMDMFAHMSLWEGVQSAGAKAIPFIHNDPNHLEKLIQKYGQGIIVVDSVYSTSGDVSPLVEIAQVSSNHNCIFIVDESHSLGTHGQHGEGMVASLGLTDKVHFRTASLAKAFAGRGGIILGSARNMEYFRYEARPAIFSSAILPHDTAGFLAAINIIKTESWRREKLHRNANLFRDGLRRLGYNVEESKSQIVSLESGLEQQTIILRDALESRDIFGSVFCSPATPKSRSLVRFSISASLTAEQIKSILKVCEEIRDEVGMENWPSTRRLRKQQKVQGVTQATQPQTQNKENVIDFAGALTK